MEGEKKEKNSNFEEAPISMLKNAEDEDFGEHLDCQLVNRPQLVRHVRDSDEEDDKPVTSSKLLCELQRLNTSYNPDAKSKLDQLDGLTQRNSNYGRVTALKWLI